MKLIPTLCLGATFLASSLLTSCASPPQMSQAEKQRNQITVIYDAFGKDPSMTKDWGFSALIEVGGKRILFDTGNDAEIFAHNVKAKGIDLTKLDFAIVSHRHGDHTSGLNYLLTVNPGVKIYAPKENFGVFGAALPGTFYRRDAALPTEMRYYDGKPPDTLHFGSPWPKANFSWVTQSTEVAPGVHLILLKGSWGVDLDVMEVSLALDTPEGIVVVAGCSHSTIEKIVEAAKAAINKPVFLVFGGTHLLPAKDEQAQQIATNLHDTLKVEWMAPSHCTGEPAFAALQKKFGDHYVYAGLGTVLDLSKKGMTMSLRGDEATLAGEELAAYRQFADASEELQEFQLAHAGLPRNENAH